MPVTDMQALTATVGRNGVNLRHEVALVQAALIIIKRPNRMPYFPGKIDGVPSIALNNAIRQFQDDHLSVDELLFEGLSKVEPHSNTYDAIRKKLPVDKRLGAIPNHNVVYRRNTEDDLSDAADRVNSDTKMLPEFRRQLNQLSITMFANHGLVLWPDIGYRTFQDQYVVDPNNTHAGPGESPLERHLQQRRTERDKLLCSALSSMN